MVTTLKVPDVTTRCMIVTMLKLLDVITPRYTFGHVLYITWSTTDFSDTLSLTKSLSPLPPLLVERMNAKAVLSLLVCVQVFRTASALVSISCIPYFSTLTIGDVKALAFALSCV